MRAVPKDYDNLRAEYMSFWKLCYGIFERRPLIYNPSDRMQKQGAKPTPRSIRFRISELYSPVDYDTVLPFVGGVAGGFAVLFGHVFYGRKS